VRRWITSTLLACALIATAVSGLDAASTPYLGTPIAVPGYINAEFFDNGGEGVAYHDSGPNNVGGQVRSGGVDIETSSEGGYDIGWISAGEWLNYTVGVVSSGNYTMSFRVSSLSGASMHVGFNGSGVWQTISIPATGGWQSWTTVTLPVTLGAGTQIMTVVFDTGGMNLRYMSVASAPVAPPPPPPSGGQGPYSGSPVPLPGIVEAENFDNGPDGVAYHDTTAGNTGGAYRSTGVDIEASSEGGYDVGWTAAGEWLNYTVNVTSAGSYTVGLRAAAPNGATLHLGFNGPSSVWSTVTIPSTGGWQNWTTVNVPVTLGAGVQQITILFDTGGQNLNKMTVSASAPVAPPAPPPPPPPTPPPSSATLRMITWNIQSGTDINKSYTLPQQVQLLASLNPDVIVLQEVSMWNENQPDKYLSLLQQATGTTWYKVWAPAITCETSGCIGPEILSRIPITAASTTYLGPSSAGRALITVGGVPINIVGNHLEAYDLGVRTSELYALMAWERQFGGPRLDGGDFNSWWGEWWIAQMTSEYHDTWVDYAGSQDGAYTIGNVRFDYIFRAFDGDWRLTPTNAFVVATTLSDHRPFVADFKVQ
jgi:endonuclease/exonuclease/phosphatase family metal-dependent hydrolase